MENELKKEKKTISVVITDLDNTLYDWVDIWYKSFKYRLEKILEKVQVSGFVSSPINTIK